MSKTYSIGCKDCKEHLWIGQSSSIGGFIYDGKDLFNFLDTHKKHNLVFDEDCNSSTFDDSKEIDRTET